MTSALDDLLAPLAAFGSPAAPVVVGAVLGGAGLVLDERHLVRTASRAAGCGLVTWTSAAVLGVLFTAAFPSLRGVPSTAAAVAFGLASAFAVHGRALGAAAGTVAALTSFERIRVGGESTVAVVLGVTIGLLAGVLVTRLVGLHASRVATGPPSKLRALAGLALLAAPLLFLDLGARPFSDPDEGRYASIPFEMIARGDFVTPTLDWALYFEKPPLLYWLVAGAFRALGFHEGVARLVPALSALSGIAVAYVLGRSMFDARSGAYGALILATCHLWPAMGRFLTIDMLFATLVVAALTTWWRGRRSPRRWLFDVAFWILVALAVLAKGPVGAVLVLGTIGLHALVCREFRGLRRPSFIAAALVGVAVAAPWFVLVSQRNPSFDHAFWYEQHVGRFLGTKEHEIHADVPWLYLVWLPPMFLPWTALAPGALATTWRRILPATTERDRAKLFLACGVVFVTGFFSASVGKLQIYVLPVIPLLSVGLGGWLAAIEARNDDRGMRHVRIATRGLAAILALGAVLLVVFGATPLRDLEGRGPGLLVALGLLLVAWSIALVIAANRQVVAAVAAIAVGSAFVTVFLVEAAPLVFPNHTFGPLLDYVRPGLDAGGELIAWRGWMQSASYYAGRRVAVYEDMGELEFGLSQMSDEERARWYGPSIREVKARLASSQPVYCVVRDHERAMEFVAKVDGAREIVWNRRRSIVGNAAAAALTPPVGNSLLSSR